MTNKQKLAAIINLALCVYVVATGIYLETNEATDQNHYVIIVGIVVSWLSIISWAHLLSRRSPAARKVRNVAFVLFLLALFISAAAVLLLWYGLNTSLG